MKPLEREDIKAILIRALLDKEKGLGMYHAVIYDDALEFLSSFAGGDARVALNAIELAVLTTEPEAVETDDGITNETVKNEEGRDTAIRLTGEVIEQCVQKKNIRYDKDGDNHYDTISAFIKSMRGSDADAAIYYLAKMLSAGEDVNFIARRIIICAAEDVGCADPRALQIAVAAQQAVHITGMPEARIILAEAVLYVCGAPKSNSAIKAIDQALETVRTTDIKTVPPHLKDSHYSDAGRLGRGVGYQYAHDYPEHYVKQQYLPEELEGSVFYKPGDLGYEKTMKERLNRLKNRDV